MKKKKQMVHERKSVSPTTTKNAKDSLEEDNNGEVQEQEERLYTAAQALLGNLNVARLPIRKDSLPGEDDEQLQRGRAAIFLLADQHGPDDISFSRIRLLKNAEKTFKDLLTMTDSTVHKCQALLLCGKKRATPLSKDASRIPWWKILQGPITSAAHVLIANGLIARALTLSSRYDPERRNANQRMELNQLAHNHLIMALMAWPCNPSALSCMANLVRMGVVLQQHQDQPQTNTHFSTTKTMAEALDFYCAASDSATFTRVLCLKLLQESDDIIGPDDKALVEGVILHLGVQVSLTEDDEDDHEENASDKKEIDEFSASAVVSTSSYMSALLASALGRHNLAFDIIRRRFCSHGLGMTRIHPAVWKTAAESSRDVIKQPSIPTSGTLNAAFVPTMYTEAVSQDFHDILRHAFRPDSPYWAESGYDRGVYYSFWIDWPLACAHGASRKSLVVSNAIEHAVLQCLLPRVHSLLSPEKLATLAGFEWWVHTRPLGANVGHQLHFDTDEALLEQDGIVDFPICASVLYLSSQQEEDQGNGHRHGATVIFDQTPNATRNAERAWIGVPRARSFVVFPGDLLHGVLPCANTSDEEPNSRKRKVTSSNATIVKEKEDAPQHRLTFMVNFWSKSIPARLRKRKLYGPSGPFPPPTRSHSWVHEINQGYPKIVPEECPFVEMGSVTKGQPLGCVSPAWELIEPSVTGEDNVTDFCSMGPPIELPKGLNQRFFVRDAPSYFSTTLHEK